MQTPLQQQGATNPHLPGAWARCLRPDHAALVALAKIYWLPLYVWLRRNGLPAPRARDGVAAAFTRWATFEPPRGTDPGADRMREWMLERITMMVTQGLKPVSSAVIEIDAAQAEASYSHVAGGDGDSAYTRCWAVLVLEQTADSLRREYASNGKEGLFDALLQFDGKPGRDESFEPLAVQLDMTTAGARKVVFEFRKRFRTLLDAIVADTVMDRGLTDSEITILRVACSEMDIAAQSTILRSAQPAQLFTRALDLGQPSSGGASQWSPPTIEEIARLFPNYDAFDVIGCGGMGAVYKARQVALDRNVAIKLLPLEISSEPSFAELFVREARAMAKLSHPNIVSVHDFGQTREGHLFFVMDLLDGRNLHQIIHEVGVVPEEALRIIGQVCEALAYAHSKGVIHRDIKPGNIIVGRGGEVKVVDFGLARLTDKGGLPSSSGPATVSGTAMGTPDYAAPEQVNGLAVDHRADIYSVGVVIYESLVGEVPRGVFDPPSQRVSVDARLDHVVTKAMHRQPDRRFQSVSEVKVAIDAISKRTMPSGRAGALPPKTAQRPTVAQSVPVKAPQRRGGSVLIKAAALLIIAILATVIWSRRDSVGMSEAESRLTRKSKSPTVTPAPLPEAPAPIAKSEQKPEPPHEPEPPPKQTAPASDTAVAMDKQPSAPTEPAPAPRPAVDPTVVTWLADQTALFAARLKAESIDPFEKATATIRDHYVAGLTARMDAAAREGKLEEVVTLRSEKERVMAGGKPNEWIEGAALPPALVQLRERWIKDFAKVDADRFARAKQVYQQFDSLLEKGQAGYTQRNRIDDAVLLKSARDEIARDWLVPPMDFSRLASPKLANDQPPAPAPAPIIGEREAIERLLKFDAEVVVERSRAKMVITQVDEIPSGRMDIREIRVRGVKNDKLPDDLELAAPKVNGPAICDADFAGFPAMRELRIFDITAGKLTGDGLGFLAGSPDLVSVVVRSSSLTNAVLDPLVGLKKIRHLELRGNASKGGKGGMTLARFAEFASWPDLQRLIITDASFAADTLPGIERARNLLHLELTIPSIGDELVSGIGKLNSLTRLQLSGVSRFPKNGISHFEKLPNLSSLHYSDCPVFIGQLEPIGRIRKLEHLTLDAVDAPGLNVATGSTSLRSISFSTYRSGTDQSLTAIAHGFPRLERLFVSGTDHQFTTAGVKELAALKNLQFLHWEAPGFNDQIAAALGDIQGLRELWIGGSKLEERISDLHLSHFAKLRDLETLTVSRIAVTSATIDALRKLRSLRELIVLSKSVSDADLAALRRAMPKCRVTRKV